MTVTTTALVRPETTIVQVSDPHILPSGRLHHDVVDTHRNLEAAFAMMAASGAEVSAVILSGDLTEDGSEESYRRMRMVVEPAAEKLGAQLVYTMGNHDERAAFHSGLFGVAASVEPHHAVHWIGQVRVIVLDSSVPGRHDGRLDDAQLGWLAEQLAEPAPQGTLLVVHHPPLPSPVPTVHLLRLHDARQLSEVVAGTDVRMILCGHTHYPGCGALAGIPVWISPALTYRTDPMPPAHTLRGVPGAGYSRIDLIDGHFVATAVPLWPSGAETGTPESPVYEENESRMVDFISSLLPGSG